MKNLFIVFIMVLIVGIMITAADAAVLNFSEGLDTYIWSTQGGPDQETGTNWVGNWFGARHNQAMIRFTDIFGADPDQIPLGSSINAATLYLALGYANEGYDRAIYNMTESWHPGIRWYELTGGNGLQAGVNMDSTPVASYDSIVGYQWLEVDVLSSLQKWSNGDTNYGWGIWGEQNNDGAGSLLAIYSFETDTIEKRPYLTVDFTTAPPVPEPATMSIIGLGLLGIIGYSQKNS